MPRKFVKYLQPYNLFICAHCHTHIACLGDLVSKAVHPIDSTAYLFNSTVNVRQGRPQIRKLISGQCEMVDLYCNVCGGGKENEPLGWKYLKVPDQKMKFKEGMFIVEKRFVKKAEWIKQQPKQKI